MKKTYFASIAAFVLAVGGGFWLGLGDDEAHPHEYAPIETIDLGEALADDPDLRQHTLRLEDFSGRSLDGQRVDAGELVEEHPVVLFTYVAEWCANCRYEAPHLARLYWKYADRGFRIVARSEYSHPEVMKEMAGEYGSPYPIIPGSLNPDPDDEDAVRTTTHHFRLRKALGDERKWGTPMNFLVVDGDRERVHAVMGEFVPEELDAFLEEHLPPADRQPPASSASGSSSSAPRARSSAAWTASRSVRAVTGLARSCVSDTGTPSPVTVSRS